MSNEQKKVEAEAKAKATEAREAAMKLLGISADALAEGQQYDNRKTFESKKSAIESCDEVAKVVEKVKTFGSPIRITIETNGETGTEPTRRITFPKSVTNHGDSAPRGIRCKVNNIVYDTMSAACDTHGLDHTGISAKVVLERALRNGTIASFDLV